MGKTIILYGSKYGTTQQYAEWIAEELAAEIFEAKLITIAKLIHYDTIIYGGAMYAGGVRGISLIRKNFEKLCHKNLIVFTCGLVGLECTKTFAGRDACIDRIFSHEMKKNMNFFHLYGRIDYSKLSFIHGLMMIKVRKTLSNIEFVNLSESEKLLLDSYGKKLDLMNKDSIDAIVSCATDFL